MFAETHHSILRPVPDHRRQPMFDQPFRIAHIRDAKAYWTIAGWGPKEKATVYAAEDRARVQLPEGGCWEIVIPQPPAGALDFQWNRLKGELALEPHVRTIAHVLNAIEAPQQALIERDITDAERIVRLARMAIRWLDPMIVEDAVEEVAEVLCAGLDGMYGPLADESSANQVKYHTWARTALNTARFVLEGVQR